MDTIWYRNPSKSEVIGRCGGDENNWMTTQNRQKSNAKKQIAEKMNIIYKHLQLRTDQFVLFTLDTYKYTGIATRAGHGDVILTNCTYHREEFHGLMYGCHFLPFERFHQADPGWIKLLVRHCQTEKVRESFSVRQYWWRWSIWYLEWHAWYKLGY